jgi:hypothetical protein
MLGYWRPHAEYQEYLINSVLPIYLADKPRVEDYSKALSKLYIMDLDVIKPILESYYSHTGKPAKNQPEIFRSFVLMSEFDEHSITSWVKRLKGNSLLCAMIGVASSDVPDVGNHYDFINRLWLENPEVSKDREDSLHPFRRKPRKKLGKNQKQPPRHPGIIQKFVDLALEGKTFESRPERLLQQIFAEVAVRPSAEAGLLGDTNNLAFSGDGTCVDSGGSPFGIKVCDCKSKGIFNCDCYRRFSDPQARHGWDSYHEKWFYGHCGYFLSVYNRELKLDLPIYLRMVQAQRFDGVTAIVALAEARKIYPDFTFERFFGDAAHDNYATYELLNAWNIKPFIPLNDSNKGNFKFPPPLDIDENGTPICMGGFSMVNWGFQTDRCRIKWRCPLVLGKVESCSCKDKCSPSPYGRTVYTKPSWDLRIFTPVPRGSENWKQEMKNRTSVERVNKRILNDYGLEKARARGKKRLSFWTTIHSINIHLDARLKISGFSFISILEKLSLKSA